MKSNNKHHKPRYLYSSVYMWILCGICLMGDPAFAAYLENIPVTLTQPDGTIIECFATGDEYYNWVHDKDGYTIIQNPTTGYYCYAILQEDELVASQYVVGKSNPLNTTLKPHVNIPPEKMLMQRENIMQNMRKNFPQSTAKSASNNFIGTLNNIVVYIRFADQTEFPAEQGYYTTLFNGTTGNSMKNYFREISYNKLTINSHFYPANNGTTILSYQDSHERNYYCPYNAETNPQGYTDNDKIRREVELLLNAISYVKDQIPSSLNLDCNNDGYVDNICFIIRGDKITRDDLLWPHKSSLPPREIELNGKYLGAYNLQIEYYITKGWGNGLLCHEMGHTLGAPDLYHYRDECKPVGRWDLMGKEVDPPQYMGAYTKYKYMRWIENIPSISEPGIYKLNPLSSSTNNCYKIPLDGTNEYLVLEYRKNGEIFDKKPDISNGLLVYRINEAYKGNFLGIGEGGKGDEIYIFRPNGTLYQSGTPSQANFSNTYNRTEFNKTTNPHCFISDGSTRDIYIKNITENADGTLSFGFSYCGNNDKVFSNTSSLPNNTNVSGSIRTTGTVTVKATDNVVFQATDYIELGAGFEVKEGGSFTVNITGCK